MSSGLCALRNYYICAGFHRFPRLSHGLHLTNQFRSGGVNCLCEWAGVTERQHDGGRLVNENTIQQFGVLREAPGDEPTPDPRISRVSPFPIDPATVSIPATKQAQPAGMADCCGEPPTGNDIHWSEQDRMLDAEYTCQAIADGHLLLLQGLELQLIDSTAVREEIDTCNATLRR
jgi:hypothetical protein